MKFYSTLYITVFLIFLATKNVHSERKIKSVVVKTSNCPQCGIGWHGSSLRLNICKNNTKIRNITPRNREGRELADVIVETTPLGEKQECCLTNRFDKAYYQDFRPGLETEYDELSIIGECANFDIGDILIAQHEGSDALKLDWIEVRTHSDEKIRCQFPSTLSNDKYYGENCDRSKNE